MTGLEWLAKVGPGPIAAWRCAMSLGERVARSHATGLEHADWFVRQPMLPGEGSLLAITRRGVRMTGLEASAPGGAQAASWANDRAPRLDRGLAEGTGRRTELLGDIREQAQRYRGPAAGDAHEAPAAPRAS
jgi:hypothetical protein